MFLIPDKENWTHSAPFIPMKAAQWDVKQKQFDFREKKWLKSTSFSPKSSLVPGSSTYTEEVEEVWMWLSVHWSNSNI